MTRVIARNPLGGREEVAASHGEAISAMELIERLKAALMTVPPEARTGVMVSFDLDQHRAGDFDVWTEATLVVDTRREETDKEVRRRINTIDPILPEYQKEPLRKLRAMLKDGRAVIAPPAV